MRRFFFALILIAFSSPAALAGEISTYLQGTIIKRTRHELVVQTARGTYWVRTSRRPPSYTRKVSEIETGFWVRLRDIKRFRPHVMDARNSTTTNYAN